MKAPSHSSESATRARDVDDAREASAPGARDERLLEQVQAALARDAAPDAGRIDVHVRGGVVTLRGTPRAAADLGRIERVVAGVPGVVGVRNRLALP